MFFGVVGELCFLRYDNDMKYHDAKQIFVGIVFIAAVVCVAFLVMPVWVSAVTIQELEGQIASKEDAIKKLEADLAKYQKELVSTKSEGVTLKKTVDRLNKEIGSLRNFILLTERRVEKKKLEIIIRKRLAFEYRFPENKR